MILGKKQMTEEDVKLQFITPAIVSKWTLDRVMEYSRDLYVDLNGNSQRDEEDFFGFAPDYIASVNAWVYGANMRRMEIIGNSDYIGFHDYEGFTLVDAHTRREIASYEIDPKTVFMGGDRELLVSDSDNQLYRLDTSKSFELLNEVPEETQDSTITFRWKPLQKFIRGEDLRAA